MYVSLFKNAIKISILYCLSTVIFAQDNLVLWYSDSATDWESEALPIGNGRIGGMIFGGAASEHIQLNDKTLWTGNKTTRGAYQNFGDLYCDFSGLSGVSGYRRELDISNAIASVFFTSNGAGYTREYFASYPDNVIVMRFTSEQSNNLSFSARIDDAHSGTMNVLGDRITISGTLSLVSYEAQVLVRQNGGTISSSSDRITVSNADNATLLLALGTNFSTTASSYLSSENLHNTITSYVNNAAIKTYEELKTAHITDFRSCFNRVLLDLNSTLPDLPTDQVLQDYKNGNYHSALEVLYFQYGRYLMLGCSRLGMDLPSNLQGIWNNSNAPPWECDIHSNINVQMN